jgi:3-hydroxyacyl-CoA dehydrogenase
MSNQITTANSVSREYSSQVINLDELKRSGKIFKENAGASIIDIGDRIGLVEFHTKANSLTDEVCEMLMFASEQGAAHFDGLVIGNQGKHFSAGANLSVVLNAARNNNWTFLDQTIRMLQAVSMNLKYGPLPVVAAPFSNALGGGCEICLHSAQVVASGSTHMGLVETGVGLIPAGGGTKELGLRALHQNGTQELGQIQALQKVFEIIVSAKVSRNGAEAKTLFLTEKDIIAPSQEAPIGIAKQVALDLVRVGYNNGTAWTSVPIVGSKGLRQFESLINQMHDQGTISDHDAIIALHVATILCGGDQPPGTASEQHFLDLEREAFLSLLGTQKTQERIEFLLKNNKPLRN